MEKENKELSSYVGRFNTYWAHMEMRVERWKKLYKTVQFYRDAGSHGYKYNVRKPITFLFAESFVSNVLNALFERKDMVLVRPKYSSLQSPVDYPTLCRQLTRILNHYFQHPDTNWFNSVESILKGLAYYGANFPMTVPRFSTDSEQGYKYLGPQVRSVEVFDFVPHPHIGAVVPGTDFFIREIVTTDELSRRARTMNYKFDEKALEEYTIERDVKSELQAEIGKESSTGSGKSGAGGKTGNRVMLLHYFRSDGHVITIAGRREIVWNSMDPVSVELAPEVIVKTKAKPYPYFPIDHININAGPNEVYGIGIAEATRQFQQLINLRTSQRLEAEEVVLQKPIIVNRADNLDIEELHTGPGNIIMVDDINDSIRVLDFPDIPQSSFQEDEIEFRLGEEIAGTPDVTRGAAPRQRITATTGTQLQQAGQQRGGVILHKMGFLIASISRKFLAQTRQYMDKAEYEAIIGEQDAGLYSLTLDQINEMVVYKAIIRDITENRQQKLQGLRETLSIAIQVPMFNPIPLIMNIMRENFPDEDPFIYIQPPDLGIAQQTGGPPGGPEGGGGPPGAANPPKEKPVADGPNYKTDPAKTQENVMERGNA